MKGFVKDFFQGMDDSYNALSREGKIYYNLSTAFNIVGSIALGAYTIHEYRKNKERRRQVAEEDLVREERTREHVTVIRDSMDRWRAAQRKTVQDIVDRARTPSSDEELEELRRKLNDPNHVWEI